MKKVQDSGAVQSSVPQERSEDFDWQIFSEKSRKEAEAPEVCAYRDPYRSSVLSEIPTSSMVKAQSSIHSVRLPYQLGQPKSPQIHVQPS